MQFGPHLVPLACLALAVAQPAAAATYRCSPRGSDTNDGIRAPWRTLQKAADTLQPGDTVLLADGTYPGGVVQKRSGRPDAPVTYRARHAGKAVVRGGAIGILIDNSDWVTLEGLTVREASSRGVRAVVSHHLTFRNCTFTDNGIEGLMTGFCDDTVVEDCEACGNGRGYSGPEGEYPPGKGHGIYLSNSGDRPVIRNTRSHDNSGCGIQVNADPAELGPVRGLVADGIISGAIIADNQIYRNARGGGAAINLQSVRDSLIVNNLLYSNLAGGIACFADYAGPEWGCRNNRFLHNTIYFRPDQGRYGLQFLEGSRGNVVRNNIIVAGLGPALEFDADSGEPDTDFNLLYSAAGPQRLISTAPSGPALDLAAWQARGHDRNSRTAPPERLFVDLGSGSPDFRLADGSPAAGAGTPNAGVAALRDRSGETVDLGWSPPAGEEARVSHRARSR
jgi:hypothetical protein